MFGFALYLPSMSDTKPLSMRQKARIIGVSPAHYGACLNGTDRPSLELAMAMEPLEGKHFLNLMRPGLFDEQGNRRAVTE